jgi:kumamolisin
VINDQLKICALGGITVCVASGDDGSGDQVDDGHAHCDFPSSSPYVLAVGGTTLRQSGGKFTEVVWKDGDGKRVDGGGSTGSGVSVHFPRPAFQDFTIKSVNPGAMAGRIVPDIVADASANTGYFIVVDGKGGVNGGTSAATPLWAALLARINAELGASKRVGYLTPVLYKSLSGTSQTVGAAGCTDITSGNNNTAAVGGYKAGPGFDAVSGWGSPIGTSLLEALKKVL